jgi:hypothetical protein
MLMSGNELIQFVENNISVLQTSVGVITGSLFTTIFLRRNTATQEFEKIKAGQFKEVTEDLLESGHMTYTEFYKANNFLAIAQQADTYHAKMEHPKEKVQHDFDWYMRFYEIVGNISDKEVQDMWARIMAGEINRPHSYSLKTIDN